MKAKRSDRFFNRELSWLEFNHRVLEEALDPSNPLLERLKFFTIVSSNLDEFFEVRVAGVKQQVEDGKAGRTPDGRTAAETFKEIRERVLRLVAEQYRCWREELVPGLSAIGIRLVRPEQIEEADRRWLRMFYEAEVRPTLTPLGIDPTHPFPQLLNKSLNLIVHLDGPKAKSPLQLGIVQVPRVLPRLVRLPRDDGRRDYVFLGQLIGHFLNDLFPGMTIRGAWPFRVTRNSELYIDEEDVANLLKAVELELQNRRRGAAVRLEVDAGCPVAIQDRLLSELNLTCDDLYLIDGPLNPTRLMLLYSDDAPPELRDPPYAAPVSAALREATDLFAAIRQRDILLHHPYESFESVVRFLRQAADDPKVLAIKQTLYRTGGDTRIVGALMDAVRNGKQVTAVVELRARFDEANNIEWARKLEENGVHVVYGLVGYKIHSKMTMVVRRDPDGIRRYLHLGTGNYNPTTARIYTDLGLLTCRPDLAEDVTSVFNVITGLCELQPVRKLLVAPFNLHERLLELIRAETDFARRGQPARIIAKLNSLVETVLIEALYEASQAGVKVDLIVRGICCLRPGVPGLSENITVRSIVGRYLEHSRIYYFDNQRRPIVLVGSADWMPRNLFKRIEVVFPVEDGVLRDRLIEEILGLQLADNVKARWLQPDGTYVRPAVVAGEPRLNSQEEFMAIALRQAGEATGDRRRRNRARRFQVLPRPAG
ncbi:MAG: polyphosphate kinase 1 [Verrucomicrobia bacterium]|nr:polyphosphate kinase 1 [Verrucomicrobiota bacterium]